MSSISDVDVVVDELPGIFVPASSNNEKRASASTSEKEKKLRMKWMPIGTLPPPAALDGTLPGDVGFDPINITANSRRTMLWMREAEIKHARLAMLGAVGWPLTELLHVQIAQLLKLPSLFATADSAFAPSLFNAGLNSGYADGLLVLSLTIAAVIEIKHMNNGEIILTSEERSADYLPGQAGFDPLNLLTVRGDPFTTQLMELKNGRLAMVAYVSYLYLESTTGKALIDMPPYHW